MFDKQPTDFYGFHESFTTYQYNLLGQAATTPASLYENSSYNSGNNGMSFSESLDGSVDYNTLAGAFGMSSASSEELFSSVVNQSLGYGKLQHQHQTVGDQMVKRAGDDLDGSGKVSTASGEVLASPGPNSSISSSSGEASGGEEDCNKKVSKGSHKDEDGDSSKKQNKQLSKKGEKRQREPRFAFMTKSEVDHLEDGYRWRKYGQKAVKNSPYPRSYYRCTTQKCNVKKRVERSFQDPSIVITTYEGQHNHPIPTTLRGSYNASGLMFSPASSLTLSPAAYNIGGSGAGQGASFINPDDLLRRLHNQYNNSSLSHNSTTGHNTVPSSSSLTLRHQQLQKHRQQPHAHADYGLLQDMFNPTKSSGDHKQEHP